MYELTSADLGRLAEIKGYLSGIARTEEHHVDAGRHAAWLDELLSKIIDSYKSV